MDHLFESGHPITSDEPESHGNHLPTWTKIDMEAMLPDGWHEAWLWPHLPGEAGRHIGTMDLLESVACHIVPSGRIVWGDLDYLVAQGLPLDYQDIRYDDLTPLRAKRDQQIVPTEADPFIAIYNYGRPARAANLATRMTFTMHAGIIHGIMPRSIFAAISGQPENTIEEMSTYQVGNNLVAVAASAPVSHPAIPDDTHIWLWPMPAAHGEDIQTVNA